MREKEILATLLTLGLGCSPDVEIRLNSTVLVPQEADRLIVKSYSVNKPSATQEFALSAKPIVFHLDFRSARPEELELEVELRHQRRSVVRARVELTNLHNTPCYGVTVQTTTVGQNVTAHACGQRPNAVAPLPNGEPPELDAGIDESGEDGGSPSGPPDASDAGARDDGGSIVDASVNDAGVPLAASGSDCTQHTECDSGFCVDGICCNSACDSLCQACRREGVCVDVAGRPDTNTCSEQAPACGDSTCTCGTNYTCVAANPLDQTCSTHDECVYRYCDESCQAPPIIGSLDRIEYEQSTDQYYVRGWTCQFGQRTSLGVHFYVDDSAYGDGLFAFEGMANLASEQAVGDPCGTGRFGRHRFAVVIPDSVIDAHAGKQLWVHGLRVVDGVRNSALSRSGTFLIPVP